MNIEFKEHGYIKVSGKVDRDTMIEYLNKSHGIPHIRLRRFIAAQRRAGKLDTTIQAKGDVIYIYLKHREMWFSICPAEQWFDDVDWKWS